MEQYRSHQHLPNAAANAATRRLAPDDRGAVSSASAVRRLGGLVHCALPGPVHEIPRLHVLKGPRVGWIFKPARKFSG